MNALECVGKFAAIFLWFFLSSSLLFPFFIWGGGEGCLFVYLLVAFDWNCFLISCRVGSSPGVHCQSPAPNKPCAASPSRGLDLSLLGSSSCPAGHVQPLLLPWGLVILHRAETALQAQHEFVMPWNGCREISGKMLLFSVLLWNALARHSPVVHKHIKIQDGISELWG